MAIGTHSFKFITNGTVNNGEVPPLFDKVPSYLDLVLWGISYEKWIF